MARICEECGESFKTKIKIDGVKKNIRHRKKCLECQPFGFKPKPKGRQREPPEQVRKRSQRYYDKNGHKIAERRYCRKSSVIQICGGGCQICGYSKCISGLAWHHLSDKDFGVSAKMFQRVPSTPLNEILKCILVCHNCHSEIHTGMVRDDVIKKLHQDLIKRITPFLNKSWNDIFEYDE